MVRGGTRHPSRAPPDIILLGVLLWIRPFRGLGELNLVTAAFEPTATATTTPSSCSSPQPAAVNVYHVFSDAQLYSTPTLQLDSKAMHGMLIASAHS